MELRSQRPTGSIQISGNQPLVTEQRTEPDVQVLNGNKVINGHQLAGLSVISENQQNGHLSENTLKNPYLLSSGKRALDLLLTLFMLPFAIPAAILCWMLVFITMGKPVIFAQHRVGLNGKIFTIYKFRSIKRNSDTKNGTSHAHSDITPVGHLLRLFRLDELPQIYNIIRGEMSWVGPRPEIPYYVEMFTKHQPAFQNRHMALPGITGLAQVRNPNATPNDNLEKLQHDLQYIRTASILTDLKILLNTLTVILSK